MVENGVCSLELSQLLFRFQNGEEEFFSVICDRYSPMLEAKVKQYGVSLSAPDLDELAQEARIALFRAATKYDLHMGRATFGLFARRCVENALCSYFRARQRQLPARELEVIDEILFPEGADTAEPVDSLIEKESLNELYKKIEAVLSPLERRVFDLHVEGESTAAMAKKLGKSEKSVANALYRMLSKLRKALK